MQTRKSWRHWIDEPFLARNGRWIAAGLFALALCIRLAHYAEFQSSPYANYPVIDARFNDETAWEIAQGDWIGEGLFWQDPFYLYALGLIYRVFGHSYQAAYLVQNALGGLLCVLIACMARRMFQRSPRPEAIGWLSGLMAALCTPFIFYEELLLKTSLGVFISTAHLLLLMRLGDRGSNRDAPYRRLAPLAGILLGFNVINRGNYRLLSPLFAIWLAWRFGALEPGRRARAASALLLYVLGACAVVGTVTLRNYAVSGEFVLTTSHGGQNFYLGNYPGNNTGSFVALPEVKANPLFEQHGYQELAERETGREMTRQEVSRYYFQKSLAWMREKPLDAAALYLKKLSLWFAGFEVQDSYNMRFERRQYSRVLDLPLVQGYTIGLLGWSALALATLFRKHARWLSLTSHPDLLLAGGFVAMYSASVLLFFVLGRYRMPIYPVLITAGSALIVWLATEWRGATRAAKRAVAACTGGTALLVFAPFLAPDWPQWSMGKVSDALILKDLGVELVLVQEYELAEKVLLRAAELEPDQAIHHLNLGVLYLRMGKVNRARQAYRAFVERQTPDQTESLYGYGSASELLLKAPSTEDFRAGLTALMHIPGEHSALPTLLALEVDGEKREVLASFLRDLLTHPSSSPAARERIANKLEELDAQAAASR